MKTIYKKLLFLLLLLPFGILAQNTVTGSVVEKATGQPIPGANVNIQGAANGVSTDFDGKYKLSNVKKGDKIVFSFIGLRTVTLTYDGQATLNASLDEDSNELKEIVVQVGYGTVKKKDATGAVTVLGAKEFNKGPVVSADQMIQGKVAGLQITNGGGAPGEGATIRIRSGSSLNASNDPLYVIDGVPVVTGGVKGGRNVLANINQNNIESITVLKDASATAIYGSRASNGVIIITTKKGKAGDLQINYNANLQVSEITKTIDALSADQFRELVNAKGSATQISLLGAANTDWQKEIYRTAIGTDHNVSVSGGADNITYRASVGYANLNGILLRDNMERSTISAALVGDFFDKHLKVQVSNNTSLINSNFSNRGAIGSAVRFDPTQAVKNTDGTYFQWYTYPNGVQTVNTLAGKNPVSLIEQQNNYGTTYRSIGNIQFDYKLHFLPELKAIANFGYDYLSGRAYGNTEADYLNGLNGSGYNNTYEDLEKRNNKLMDLYFNYNKLVESISTQIDFTGGYNYQDFRDNYGGFNLVFQGNNLTPVVNRPRRVNLQSFFARANFTIADKYLLTASYRRDGSSRFAENNRWSNFPAVAVAWKIKDENFLKDVESVSTLKLRAGWGITGQQDIGGDGFPSLPLYSVSNISGQYPFGNVYYPTYRPSAYNLDLKWEETTTINAGIDFGFLNNRITGAVDVYQRDTKDLLLYTQNPPFFGFSNFDNYNVGKIRNRGLEISGTVIPVKNDNFEWTVGGNITFQNSEITALSSDAPEFIGINVGGYEGGTGNTIQNHQIGYAPFSFYVYEQAYDAAGKPMDGVFIDRNGDGLVNEKDKYRFHKPAADVFYGFNTSLTYKNWDFAAAFRGSWGNYMYNNVDSNNGSLAGVLINPTYLSNAVENVLETGFTTNDIKRFESDYYIQDASFLRLDNVSIGYTFNQKPDSKSLVKLTLAAQNVFVVTKYAGLDPEIASGIDNNLYPRPITFTLGLNVNF